MNTTLYVKLTVQFGRDVANNADIWQLTYTTPDTQALISSYQYITAQGTPQNPSASPYPIFPTNAAAIAYYNPIAGAALVNDFNSAYGTTLYTGYDIEVLDPPVKAAFDALPPAGGTRTQSALSLSLVGTGATGTQISATNDALILCTVSTSATATIAGSATSTVALKICSTNNATEANWTTVATSETSQAYSLAVALQGVAGMKEQLSALVPAGWYAKLVNSGSGTHSESFLSGQKVIFS